MIDATLASTMHGAATESFDFFAQRAFRIIEPSVQYEWNWHIGCIADHLEANLAGELPWLIINMPPRMLKSTLVAQLYPAWVMGKEPGHQFINATYGHSLAERNVINCRKIMNAEYYKSLFPNTQIDPKKDTNEYFLTTANGQYKGTGIGGSITGFGCRTMIIDDPINPKEGASDTVRAKTNEEIRSTLLTRFNDRREARLILIMQRVHSDDPTGMLMLRDRYYVLKLPAEAKQSIYIPNPRITGKGWQMQPGEFLTDRLTKEDLLEVRDDLGEYNYVGQYLQEPVPVGGGEFKGKHVRYYQSRGIKPKTMNICILCDPSAGETNNKKKKKLSDFSAFMVVGLGQDNNYYLLDAVRDRLNPTQRIETLFMLHRKWNKLSGKPPKVGYERYGMMTDNHYIQNKMGDDAYYFNLIELGGQVDKESRIRRLIPDFERGRWLLPANLMYTDSEDRTFDLVHELVTSEMPTFPKARFDDMLDALSRVYDADMEMVFPELEQTEDQKILDEAFRDDEDDTWLNF